MSDLLQNLITEVHAALSADPDFKSAAGKDLLTFIIEDDGNIDTLLATALGRMGLCCIIDLVGGSDDAPNVSSVVLNPVDIVLDLSENVLLNRKGEVGIDYLTQRQALAMLMAKLKQFTYSSGAALILETFRSAQPARGADASYQIFCSTSTSFTTT